jgi:basic membrane protein A and related proteins
VGAHRKEKPLRSTIKGRTGVRAAALAVVGVLALAACGSSSSGGGSGTSGSPSASGSNIKVGMAYDIGGRGDKSFNDAAAAGLDKAKKDFGVQSKELSAVAGETDAQKEARLELLAAAGYNPVIAVGFAYAAAVKDIVPKYPNINFAIIDDSSFAAPNLANLVFAANQGSYIVGVIAAKASKTGTVGFIGGVNVPLLQSFQAGFDAGAKATNPNIKIIDKYLTQPPDFTGFNDAAKGQTTGQGMYDQGADVVYAAAGGSGTGVFKAAKASGKLAIGVDSDQYLTAGDLASVVLTSALKRVDTATYDMIQSSVQGSPLTGVQTFDLKNDGVGYSKSNPAVQPYEAAADAAEQQIISGAVTVPDKLG